MCFIPLSIDRDHIPAYNNEQNLLSGDEMKQIVIWLILLLITLVTVGACIGWACSSMILQALTVTFVWTLTGLLLAAGAHSKERSSALRVIIAGFATIMIFLLVPMWFTYTYVNAP